MSVSPGAPALTVARLAALLQQAARELPVWDRGDPTYEPLAAWLLPRLAAEGPVSRGAPTPAMIAALCAGVPQWHEVDQGGEVFGWKVPDERGCYQVVPAPRTIEHYTAAVLEALRAALTAQEETS